MLFKIGIRKQTPEDVDFSLCLLHQEESKQADLEFLLHPFLSFWIKLIFCNGFQANSIHLNGFISLSLSDITAANILN